MKTLLERLAKLEQNQAHFLTVLKNEDMQPRMVTALQSSDIDTVRAFFELGLHDVNEMVRGRMPLSVALDKHGHSHRKPECLPELAHYLLDVGADCLAPDQTPYEGSLPLLCSMVDPDSVARLELLIRCETKIKESESYAARGVEGLIVTRAVMAGRIDLLTPDHLAADVNTMSVEVSRDSKNDAERQAMEKLTLDGYSYGLKLWLQPLNYLALIGTDDQFKQGLSLGLPVSESPVLRDNEGRKRSPPASTVDILEGMGRDDRVFMLRSALARREAHKAIEDMTDAPVQASPRP